MDLTFAELEARLRAARDQEDILIWALTGESALISRDEIPARIEALGDTYQRVVIVLGALAEGLAGTQSPMGDCGYPIATER